ncbi:MAG: hypothetical protein ACI9OJ_000640, partial [Myxococcota bacterium]
YTRREKLFPQTREIRLDLRPGRLPESQRVVEQRVTRCEHLLFQHLEINYKTIFIKLFCAKQHLKSPSMTMHVDARPAMATHVMAEVNVDAFSNPIHAEALVCGGESNIRP